MSNPYYSKLDNPYPSGPPPVGYGAPPPGYPPAYTNAPDHRNVPRYTPDYRRRSSGSILLRCVCCCCCFSIFIVLTVVIFTMVMFKIYDPKVPDYTIDGIQVKVLDVLPDSTLNAEFQVTVMVDNPNKKFGFNYGADSPVEVLFMDHVICGGMLPSFHQDPKNSVDLNLTLKGRSPIDPALQKTLSKCKKAHNIPMDVNVIVPVNIVMGDSVTFREFRIYIYFHLALDKLAPNAPIGIISKDMRSTFEL